MGDEFDESKHPRDANGRFGAGGSSLGKWADSKNEPIGYKQVGKGEGTDWDAKWYSFGKVDATHAKTIELNDELAKKHGVDHINWMWGKGAREVDQILKKEFGKIDVPPGHMLVFRVGDGAKESLSGKQGANMKGIANFLLNQADREFGTGDKLSAYIVKKPEKFTEYKGGQAPSKK